MTIGRGLITVYEVIDRAPAGHHFDRKLLEPFLEDAAFELCSDECFGDDFYIALECDQIPFTEFDACRSYITDDEVVYGAKFYKALNDAPAGTLPTDELCWVEVTKFQDPDYQELYDKHLRDYLVFSVLHYAVPSIAYRAATAGIMRNNTEFSESASSKGVFTLKNDWQNRRETRYKAMYKFLTQVNELHNIDNVTRYPLFPANAEQLECGKDCKPGDNPINIPFP